MYNLKVHMENLPKDAVINLHGLGSFTNNTTTFIDKATADQFIVTGTENQTSFDENGTLTVTVVAGPDIPTFFKDAKGITVTTAKAKPTSDGSEN